MTSSVAPERQQAQGSFSLDIELAFKAYLESGSSARFVITEQKDDELLQTLLHIHQPIDPSLSRGLRQALYLAKHKAQAMYRLVDNKLLRYKKTGTTEVLLAAPTAKNLFTAIKHAHEELAHAGVNKTLAQAKLAVYGATQENVNWLLKRCKNCLVNRPNHTRAPLQPIISSATLERVQMDLIDMRHEPSDKFRWILHLKDHYSKFTSLYALKTKEAIEVAKKLEIFVAHYGPPQIFQADNGKEFKGAVLILIKKLRIKIINGRPRTPQTQGLVEQANSVVKDKLRKWKLQEGRSDWASALAFIASAMNKQTHSSLPRDLTPWKVFFGRPPALINAALELTSTAEQLTDQQINDLCADGGSLLDEQALDAALESISGAEDPEQAAASPTPSDMSWIDIGFAPPESRPVSRQTSPINSRPNSPEAPPYSPLSTGGPEDTTIPTSYPVNSSPALWPELPAQEATDQRIQQHQTRARLAMVRKYGAHHAVQVFEEGQYVTIKLHRDVRTATDDTRVRGKILQIPRPGRHKVLTKWGVLDHLLVTRDLNLVPLENKADYDRYFLDAPLDQQISFTAVGRNNSTSDRQAISCTCKKDCTTRRCICIKNGVKCTQYCLKDGCSNAGTVADGTQAALVPMARARKRTRR